MNEKKVFSGEFSKFSYIFSFTFRRLFSFDSGKSSRFGKRRTMVKPEKIKSGDKIATISLSWGGAGLFKQRYEIGIKQLKESLGLIASPTRHSMKSPEWLYNNPKARAEDLMEAFQDNSVKAIISNIGGDDSIRILRYVDWDLVKNNPKPFIGFSDSTVIHMALYKIGIVSYYGPAILSNFAENGGCFDYTIDNFKKVLFSPSPLTQIKENKKGWTHEFIDWSKSSNQTIVRERIPSSNWNYLQGVGKTYGHFLGGNVTALEFLKGTKYWPPLKEWKNAILFLETAEDYPSPQQFRYWLRNYVEMGVMHQISGLLLGRPFGNRYGEEYNEVLMDVINKEEGLSNLTIVTEMDFGHNNPIFTIPYGIRAEIDSQNKNLSVLENCVR